VDRGFPQAETFLWRRIIGREVSFRASKRWNGCEQTVTRTFTPQ